MSDKVIKAIDKRERLTRGEPLEEPKRGKGKARQLQGKASAAVQAQDFVGETEKA